MARPEEWKGSDLRSRAEVVQYLKDHGGEVTNKQGLTVGIMREKLGKGRALTQLLADMEADGMIEREVRGRRTFRITLKDDWGLGAQRPQLRAVPQVDDLDDVDTSGVALGLLADVLLQRVIRRATEPASSVSAGQLKQLADRLKRAEASLESTQRQLRAAQEERQELEDEVRSLRETNAALEHNLALMQRELAKPRRCRRLRSRGREGRSAPDEVPCVRALLPPLARPVRCRSRRPGTSTPW